MNNYKKKLLLTALFLLFSFICIASYLSYINAKKIITDNLIVSKQGEVSVVTSRIEDIYKETKDRLDLLSSEKNLSTYIEQINQSEGLFDKGTVIQKLHFNLISKLASQLEFTALYVITDNFIAGYTNNNISCFSSIIQDYDWNQMNQNTAAFNTLKASLSNVQFSNSIVEDRLVVSQIKKGQYLVGVLDYGQALQYKPKNLFILNKQGNILYSSCEDIVHLEQILYSIDRNSYTNYQVSYIGNEKYILTYDQAFELQLECILVTDMDELYAKLQTPTKNIIITNIILLFFFLLIIIILTNKLIKPLEQFNHIIANITGFDDTKLIDNFILANKDRKSLHKRVFLLYFLNFIPLFIIIIISYLSFSKVIEDETFKSYNEVVMQTGESIEYRALNHLMFANYLTFDQEIQNQLIAKINDRTLEENDAVENDTTKSHFSAAILMNQSLTKKINYIKLYDTNFNLIYSSNPNKMDNNINNECREYLEDSSNYNYWNKSSLSNNISFIKKVKYLPQNDLNIKHFKLLGYLELVSDKFLTQNLNILSTGFNSFNCIMDQSGKIMETSVKGYYNVPYMQDLLRSYDVSKNQHDIVYLKSGKTLVSIYKIKNTDWSLISFIPLNSIIKENMIILFYSIILFIILLLLVLNASNLFTREMLKPLVQLQTSMKEVEYGKTPSFKFQSKYNEFTYLAENFKDMLIRLNSLGEEIREKEVEKIELEKRKKESQLVALQTQINPHFLYNIFISINMLLRMRMVDDAQKMLNAAAQLFRIGIYHGNNIVKVAEEIQHVKVYMEIQQIRFKDKISILWDIDESVMNLKMPKLILQPLVENAIEHGLKKKKRVNIKIKFTITHDTKLRIEIEDDGIGIEASELEQIKERLVGHTQSEHIGLANVNERIQLYFGLQYGLTIDSEIGMGTVIQITLPVLEQAA